MQSDINKNKLNLQAQIMGISEQVKKQQDLKIYKEITLQGCNVRNILKKIRRLINHDEEEIYRKFIQCFFVQLILKNFVIGTVQTKIDSEYILRKLQYINCKDLFFVADSFNWNNFTHLKHFIQCLQLANRTSTLESADSIKNLSIPIILNLSQKLLNNLQQGRTKIIEDNFRTQWLQKYVQILRSANLLIRILPGILKQNYQVLMDKIQKICRDCLQNHQLLSKDIMIQLYLLLLQLNPNEKQPQQSICILHYLNARSIVYNVDNLENILNLMPKLRTFQHRNQIVPILLKSVQKYFHNYPFKHIIFDKVITLFEVGRSVYNYLEQILQIIIKGGATWNIEGNLHRKFFITKVVLERGISIEKVKDYWPNMISNMISVSMSTVPYGVDCVSMVLKTLYQENNKNYEKWMQTWFTQYQYSLLASDKISVCTIMQFMNPIIISIDNTPILLQKLIQLQKNHPNLELGIVSLMKCYRQQGKIMIDEHQNVFVLKNYQNITFTYQYVQNLLLSSEEMVALKAFQFVTQNQKLSEPLQPIEYELIIIFYQHCIKTSLAQYRKNYLHSTKKLFERLRIIYNNDLMNNNNNKKPKVYFSQFLNFLKRLINICYKNIYPDVIFEQINPTLQIIILLLKYFNRNKIQIKKNKFLEGIKLLDNINFYTINNFNNLLSCLKSSYQNIRKLSYTILLEFQFIHQKQFIIQLYQQSLKNINKLSIKNYQYSARILILICQKYPEILKKSKQYNLQQLNIYQYFLIILKNRYNIFKQQFAKQNQSYYNNLIHGILTCLSYLLDNFTTNIKYNLQSYKIYFNQIQKFLAKLCQLISQILVFSVEISSSNISTVVLDTLIQPQTDRKFKVDCRGHFLENTPNIGNLLESTALTHSMEDEEQGIQNSLVVSFYLVTRQAGLLFQSIGRLIQNESSSSYMPTDELINLVNTYFYALINLKHMGSVDRISTGLGMMSRVLYQCHNQSLSELPEILLNKLLQNLKSGKFTNILRRSSGVPYAFSCLLRSQALKRKHLINKTLETLFTMSKSNSKQLQIRIHSLNILKKLFQDSDLKNDLINFESQAFITSINGFSSQDWGVRNSSLMLFTTLANRTIGIRPTFNLLQFFHRCPQMLTFMTDELRNMQFNTMYPHLYPISLLLSRLLPFDIKDKSKMTVNMANNPKQMRKEELLSILPLIQNAGRNNNYMGRIMTAKAILPFMSIDNILCYCLSILQTIINENITSNNILHFKIATCNQLLQSLEEITEKYKNKNIIIIEKIVQDILNNLYKGIQKMKNIKCAIILDIYLNIYLNLIRNYAIEMQNNNKQKYKQFIFNLIMFCQSIVHKYVYSCPFLIIPENLGHSAMLFKCLQVYFILLQDSAVLKEYYKFITMLIQSIKKQEKYIQKADTEIISFYLTRVITYLNTHKIDHTHQIIKCIHLFSNTLNIKEINNDILTVQILQLYKQIIFPISAEMSIFLLLMENDSTNLHVKIAIFNYLSVMIPLDERLLILLYKFSHPQQLQELRICCLQYLLNYGKDNQEHYVVYIRLLEDQDNQIRKNAALIISHLIGTYHYNQNYLRKNILKKLTIKDIQFMIKNSSDYETKQKNNVQERIFCHDKPNKYRSDIDNLVYVVCNNTYLKKQKSKLNKLFNKIPVEMVQDYLKNIINRNEYKFENIIRWLITSQANNNDLFLQQISQLQPMLGDIYHNYRLQ